MFRPLERFFSLFPQNNIAVGGVVHHICNKCMYLKQKRQMTDLQEDGGG